MTPNALVACIEEAAEYGDRFPDQSEADVLEHVTEVCKLSALLTPDLGISRCILRAYNYGEVELGIETAKVWGFLDGNFKYDPNKLYLS